MGGGLSVRASSDLRCLCCCRRSLAVAMGAGRKARLHRSPLASCLVNASQRGEPQARTKHRWSRRRRRRGHPRGSPQPRPGSPGSRLPRTAAARLAPQQRASQRRHPTMGLPCQGTRLDAGSPAPRGYRVSPGLLAGRTRWVPHERLALSVCQLSPGSRANAPEALGSQPLFQRIKLSWAAAASLDLDAHVNRVPISRRCLNY